MSMVAFPLTLERSPPMSTVTAAASDGIDLRAFRDNGAVSEAEYNRIVQRLQAKLTGMRVPSIRKGLVLEPLDFDAYVAEAQASYDRQWAPISDPELGVDLNVILVSFQAKFSMSMFRNFADEYVQFMSLDSVSLTDVAINASQQGYALVPTTRFHSLLLAALQIEEEIGKRYAASTLAKSVASSIGVETRFFVPLGKELDDNRDMTIQVDISLFPDE